MTQEGGQQDMWTPYKDLLTFVENVVSKPVHGVMKQLEEVLRNHKQNFITLLKNSPKDAQSREEIRKALSEGAPLPNQRHQLLSKELVDETFIISDMYDLNEYLAFDLLCTAQLQMPFHPGLPRGLVAVLLYYDGRRCLVLALKTLVQARKGVSWVLGASPEVTRYVTLYTRELLEQGVLLRVVDLLGALDVSREVELLQGNRALGGPRHHREVMQLYQGTRQGLADVLYCWAAQCGLPRAPTFKLMEHLKKMRAEEDAAGQLDDVSATLQMALLYALDLSVLHTKDDGEELARSLPLVADADFMPILMKEFLPLEKTWQSAGLQALAQLAWALALATLRLAPTSLHSLTVSDEDELLVDSANELGVFEYLHRSLLRSPLVHREEFFMRRLHTLLADFIVFLPMKVKEMKSRSDESARTIQAYLQEGLEPPPGLPHHFEQLLLAVAALYRQDPLRLELALEFWGPTEGGASERFLFRSPPRQVALFKFLRLGGDVLPPAVFVPYMRMLRSLASSPRSARCAFNFLKQNCNGSATVSWGHFFKSLERYYSNLRQELPPSTDTVYQHRAFPRGILPQEIQGLQAVLGVVRTVAEQDEVSRSALADSPQWGAVPVLLGLVACAVPIPLKAELLRTLAALARSPGPATALWYSLEQSQILSTVPSTSSYQPRGIQTELEEVEARNEEFPLTRAVLQLLDVLTDVPVPRLLGVEARTPGFDPYLNFIVNSVFLRFNTRSYKNPEEKWEVASACLSLLAKLLSQYRPDVLDFTAQRVELPTGGLAQVNPVPGYHIMVNLSSKTELLRLVLHLLDEGIQALEGWAPVPGQGPLEAAMLSCLQLLQRALGLQELFAQLLASSGSSLLLPGLRRLLLDVNPRSGKPDHLLNITRYVTLSSWLPEHALASVQVLLSVAAAPSAQAHLLSLFTASPSLALNLRNGFVECLEADEELEEGAEEEEDEGSGASRARTQTLTKEAIFQLLHRCLHCASPNLSHFLLGFDLKKISRTVFQQPGVLGAPRTCLHSLLSILDASLGARSQACAGAPPPRPALLEASYCMLHLLASDLRTSGPVLRFLRACGDFLGRHLAQLPLTGPDHSSCLVQMAWLLKTVAVELKAVARNEQLSNLRSLVTLLTRERGEGPDDHSSPILFEEDADDKVTRFLSRRRTLPDPLKIKKERVLLTLLNQLDFQVTAIQQPDWEFFVPALLNDLYGRCEAVGFWGQRLVDVKRLHQLLLEELAAVQSSTSAAQRGLVLTEIEAVLRFAVRQNRQRARCGATVSFMDAWRQVTETLFIVEQGRVLSSSACSNLIVDCLHVLLKKVLASEVLPDLSTLSSGAVLLLAVSLQQQLVEQQRREALSAAPGPSGPTPLPIASALSFPGRPGIFDTILSNVLEWILNSGVSSQKLRINLYGALLTFVRMACQDVASAGQEGAAAAAGAVGRVRRRDSAASALYISRLDSSHFRAPAPDAALRRQACLDVIMGFGEGLIDVLCHDCTGGHDVCKMLALSCLGLLVECDPHTSWVSYLSSRGYLRHIIDSLLDSDDKLAAMVGVSPSSLSPLYVYESKMAMLCRVASAHSGAELLLEQGVFGCLAAMSVFDKHPDFKPNTLHSDLSFVPTARSRFQQILFPALGLCDAVLTTLGPDNRACCAQIQFFLFSHYEMLSMILRCSSPLLQVKFLHELARITGLIARIAHVTEHELLEGLQEEEVATPVQRRSVAQVRGWMLELMRHFVLSESLVRELRGPSGPGPGHGAAPASGTPAGPGGPSAAAAHTHAAAGGGDSVLAFLQVACNLALYARRVIAGHGLDREANHPIFWAALDGAYSDLQKKGPEEREAACPPLGLVVEQLVQCVAFHQREKATLDLLQHKQLSLGSSSLQADSAMEDRGAGGDGSAHPHPAQQLGAQLARKRQELDLAAFLVDNCLYLIWCHMDFFVRMAQPSPPFLLVAAAAPRSVAKVSQQQLAALKQGLVSTFNDRFSKNLVETQQDKSATDRGFVEALLRRTKRLVQFAPAEKA